MVAFQNIPVNTFLVPGVYFEVNANNANTALANQNTLIVGQMLSPGSATAGIPVQCGSLIQASALFGPNSMLYNMFAIYIKNDPLSTIYCLPLADNGSGAAATGTIVYSGTVTAPGVHNLYVGGMYCPVTVTASEATTAIATAVAAAINLLPNAWFTAAATSSTVTITASHKGIAAGDVDIRLNYRGAAAGEVNPAGLVSTITAMSGGTLDPVLATPLANIPSSLNCDFIVLPYSASSQLTDAEAFVNDTSGRWSYIGGQVYGGLFGAVRNTYSGLATFGLTNNNQHYDVVGFNDSPSSVFHWASAWTGANASSLKVNPATPVGGAGQGVVLQGILAPPLASQFSTVERQTLLVDGISTFLVDQAGVVRVERSITSFQFNQASQPDNSFKDINVPYILMSALRQYWTFYAQNYGRNSIVSDDTPIPFGSPAVSPAVIKAGSIGKYLELCNQGLCQNPAQFNQNVQVILNPANPTAVEVYLPLIIANPLIDIFVLCAFSRI